MSRYCYSVAAVGDPANRLHSRLRQGSWAARRYLDKPTCNYVGIKDGLAIVGRVHDTFSIAGLHARYIAMAVTDATAAHAPATKDDEKEPQIRGVDNGEVENALQREVSGPPYSVFTKAEKIWIITLVSTSALISPFGATLFYPVLNVLSDVLHVTPTMTNISITTYMVIFSTSAFANIR